MALPYEVITGETTELLLDVDTEDGPAGFNRPETDIWFEPMEHAHQAPAELEVTDLFYRDLKDPHVAVVCRGGEIIDTDPDAFVRDACKEKAN